MPRTVTATLANGQKVTYGKVPYSVTPGQMAARIQKDYGQRATMVDGGGAPQAGTADYYEHRWAGMAPARAKALVSRYMDAANANGSGQQFFNDPRVQGLMRVAGIKSAAVRIPKDQAIREAGAKAATQEDGSPSFFNAVKAGVIRGGFGIPERVAAGVLKLDPNNKNSYADTLALVRARNDAEMAQSGTGNVLGQLIGGGIVGGGAAKLAGQAIGRVAAAAPQAAGRVANVLQAATRAAPKTMSVARTAAGGAVGGAVQAAGEGSDVGEGAATGAGAGVAFKGAAKVAAPIFQRAGDFLGTSSAASVLRRYTSETAESMAQKLADFRSRTGTEPTVFELLGTGDRQKLRKAIGLMPDEAREQVAANVRQRAANVGRDLQGRVNNLTADAQNTRAANLAQQLANSRAQGVTPTPDEIALAGRAVDSPMDMDTVRSTMSRNIMAPHENEPLFDRVSDLYPQHPQTAGDGSVTMVESDPQISQLLRTVAGSAALKPDGLNGSDVSAMVSRLRGIAGKGGIEGAAATNALDHLDTVIGDQHPAFADSLARMTASHSATSRTIEGMAEGAATRTRETAPVTQAVRNAYDTPEGTAGRAMGQTAQLRQDVGGTPEQALSAAREIGASPNMQAAINANVGNNAGTGIADSAAGVSESARRLAGLVNEAQDTSSDPAALLHGLMGLSPSTLPHTKLYALSRIANLGSQLPRRASNQLADALFSQNPTQIGRALTFLNNAGDAGRKAMDDIAKAVSIGAAGTALSQDPAPDQPQAAPQAPVDSIPQDIPAADNAAPAVDPAEPPAQPAAAPVAEADSPYLQHLAGVYNNEDPAILDLADRVQAQESGGKQHDDNGRVKISKAGAIGTMQLMPGTAPEAAKLAGLPFDENALHNDPVYNKALGIAYLTKLLGHYGGDKSKAIAAYNAGQGSVDRAINHDADNWLAHLPAETQNYVQRVS